MMNMNVNTMDYTELCNNHYITQMCFWDAENDGDTKRMSDMQKIMDELQAEIDKREAAVREEEAAEERAAIDELLASVFEEDDKSNFENVIIELRREGVDFVPYESDNGRIRHIMILGKGNDVFRMLTVEFQTGRIFNHISIGGKPGKTYTITARALALKAAQFQRI